MSRLGLGIDIGGTKLAVGLVELGERVGPAGERISSYRVRARRQMPSAEAGDGEPLLEQVAALAEAVCKDGGVHPEETDGVGVALPGPVDPRSQRLIVAHELTGLTGLAITDYFAGRWNRRDPAWVLADNDANVAALGEALYGAGRGSRVVCYFTVSTGIGGGVVIDGRLFRGATGQAGEFGHMKLGADGPRCACGNRGCLEALASGTALARRAREAVAAAGSSAGELARLEPAALTAERLAAAARRGDPLARRVWSEGMADLGAGIATVVQLFNPDRVVIGGGVSRSADLLLPPVRRVVQERAMPMLARAVRIEAAELGDDVGIVGAAALSAAPGM